MTLCQYFIKEGITLFASLPMEAVPVRMPRLLSPVRNPQTVVFAAVPYFTDSDSNLARFARVRDYHAFAARLGAGAIACLKKRRPDLSAAAFADHSPFDEVTGAAMAGIGLRGDHGLIITEVYSSYVFLFSLVSDLSADALAAEGIPQGTGEIRRCAGCGACARACPGGCIGGDRAACLSAISQKKGDLTETEREAIRRADFAWGCDACQEACPHTRAARDAGTLVTPIPYFRDSILGRLTPDDVEAMPEETYKSYAFGWRPKGTLIRNLTLQEENR